MAHRTTAIPEGLAQDTGELGGLRLCVFSKCIGVILSAAHNTEYGRSPSDAQQAQLSS